MVTPFFTPRAVFPHCMAAWRSTLRFGIVGISVASLLAICGSSTTSRAEDRPPEPQVAAKSPAKSSEPPVEQPVEQLVAQAKPAVVVISTTGRDGQQFGMGTGFVIRADGLIATNLHVIGEARPIQVQLADGQRHDVVAVHASDRHADLALLKIDAAKLPALPLGNAEHVQQGQSVVMIGNPLGLRHSVVAGVVSARREMEGRKMLQLAIPVERGNSGGPVLDRQGRVVGIVTMKSAVEDNLGFAVEISLLEKLLAKPNPVPMNKWLTIGALDARHWKLLHGAQWRQRAGRISVEGAGQGFGGRALCLQQTPPPKLPYECTVAVRLDDEAGAAGLVFAADGKDQHYGFYPSNGKLRLTRFDGPDVFTWQVLHDVATPHYRPGQWNRLKVRLEADRLVCYVNDQQVLESTDKTFRTGAVGLAKFRQTKADFKGFRVAAEIAAAKTADQPPKWQAEIDQLLANSATADPTADAAVRALGEPTAASLEALRRRAQQLQDQARKLEQLASELRARQACQELERIVAVGEERLDLARAALWIARLDNEELDLDAYVAEIDRLAHDIAASLPKDADEAARRQALDRYLFAEQGFHGSRTEYYHRSNSYLNEVLDDREGLPITLSVLYLELASRLKLNVVGVGLPSHFIVQHRPTKGPAEWIDVFDGGTTLDRAGVAKLVREQAGVALADEHLEPVTKRAILTRMLRNLFALAQRDQDPPAMLRYLDATIVVADEDVPQFRATRSVLRLQLGRRAAALEDLDWLLKTKPPGLDLPELHRLRTRLATEDAKP